MSLAQSVYWLAIDLHKYSFDAYINSLWYLYPAKQDFQRNIFVLDQVMQLEKQTRLFGTTSFLGFEMGKK